MYKLLIINLFINIILTTKEFIFTKTLVICRDGSPKNVPVPTVLRELFMVRQTRKSSGIIAAIDQRWVFPRR
jgi:hypothetical protein